MKQTVNESTFIDAFRRHDRMVTDDNPDGNFTYDALCALYDFLIEIEESVGEEMELDVVALCCEWSQYKTAVEAANQYGEVVEDCDEPEEEARKWLLDNTNIVDFGGGVVVMDW